MSAGEGLKMIFTLKPSCSSRYFCACWIRDGKTSLSRLDGEMKATVSPLSRARGIVTIVVEVDMKEVGKKTPIFEGGA